MPGVQHSVHDLPKSFLEAMAEYQSNPLAVLRRHSLPYALPFIGGGAPDDDDGDGDDKEGSGSGQQGDGDGTGDASEQDGNGDEDGDDEDGDEGLPENVKAILRKNRKATRDAERRAERAEKAAREAGTKIKEYDDRDKTELQKAQDRAKELETENSELRDANKLISLRSAFLSHTAVTWVDPEDALELALRKYGLKDLELNADTGTVKDKKALTALVKEMAKEKSYLVKPGDDAGDGKDGDAGKRQASGGSFNGGKGKDTGKNADSLAGKYPALRGRRRVP